jgi:16S rRNA G966 N2-methylase RsmD
MVPKLSASYSLIYSDPPYQQQCVWHGKKVTLSDALLSLIDKSTLLKDGGLFFLEDAAPIENSELQSLLLKDVRKYGIASLSIYQKREIS